MQKIVFLFLAVASLSLSFSACHPSTDTALKKPIGPTTDESDMPWNRPTGPEGAGALGMLNDR